MFNPKSGRIRVVDKLKSSKIGVLVNIEVATEGDADLVYGFIETDSITSEPLCVTDNIQGCPFYSFKYN